MNCKKCGFPAVGSIPMPVEIKGTHESDIPICERHCQKAIRECYYVVRYDETHFEADARFIRMVNEKHGRLRRGVSPLERALNDALAAA